MKIPPLKQPRETANTLLVTLVTLAIVGFLMVTYLKLTQSQNKATMRSQSWNLSMALVEAGLEEALAHLNVNGSNGLARDGWTQTGTGYTKSRWLGDNYYTVTITNYQPGYSNSFPAITARGYVPLTVATADAGMPTVFADTSDHPAIPYIGRGVRVHTGVDRLFARGMVARDTIDLNGNNIATDSFDSSDPRYSTNGVYSELYRRANGDIASNAGITNAVNVGNANIRGHIATGPKGTVSIGPQGSVGDLDWVKQGKNGIQTGYVMNDMNMSFPDVKEPFTGGYGLPSGGWVTNTFTTVASNNSTARYDYYPPPGSPLLVVTNQASSTLPPPLNNPGPVTTKISKKGTITYYYPVFDCTYATPVTNTTVTVQYYDYIFASGNYYLSALEGSVYVGGQVNIYVTTALDISALTVAKGQRLDLYSAAPSSALAGNTTINSDGYANSFHFWGLPSCTSLTFSGNASFTGTIYAPQASFVLNGAGSDVIDFIGASVTKTARMNGHFNFHYDEVLGRYGPARGYYITSWTELNPEEVPLIKRW